MFNLAMCKLLKLALKNSCNYLHCVHYDSNRNEYACSDGRLLLVEPVSLSDSDHPSQTSDLDVSGSVVEPLGVFPDYTRILPNVNDLRNVHCTMCDLYQYGKMILVKIGDFYYDKKYLDIIREFAPPDPLVPTQTSNRNLLYFGSNISSKSALLIPIFQPKENLLVSTGVKYDLLEQPRKKRR